MLTLLISAYLSLTGQPQIHVFNLGRAHKTNYHYGFIADTMIDMPIGLAVQVV